MAFATYHSAWTLPICPHNAARGFLFWGWGKEAQNRSDPDAKKCFSAHQVNPQHTVIKEWKEDFPHATYTQHISFSVSALPTKIYYLLTELSRELNWPHKSFLCHWYSINLIVSQAAENQHSLSIMRWTFILLCLQTVLLQTVFNSNANVWDKPLFPKLFYIGTFRKINSFQLTKDATLKKLVMML